MSFASTPLSAEMRARGCREYALGIKKFVAGSSSAKVEGPNRPAEVPALQGVRRKAMLDAARLDHMPRFQQANHIKMMVLNSFPHFIPSLHII
jgi:hypothetical protein